MDTEHQELLHRRLAEWRRRLSQPWLVAAWPGMGSVAQVAQAYLAQRLGAQPIGAMPADDFFDLRSVDVERGLILPPRERKSMLFGWKNPTHGRDLVFFQADAQPEHGAGRFCEQLVDVARELGAVRVCTFAAMATMIHPEAKPRVFAVASNASLLAEVRRSDAEPLADGSIGGLNGLLVAVAARAGIDGICLLGEIPYFASSIPNPKACAAVLRTFSRLAEVDVDLEELDANAAAVERSLVEHLKRAEQLAASLEAMTKQPAEPPEEATEQSAEQLAEAARDRETKARIEALFEQARRDRSTAPQLKAALDRHRLWEQYQDRFLDLWKRAE